jgi:hypothetical protein
VLANRASAVRFQSSRVFIFPRGQGVSGEPPREDADLRRHLRLPNAILESPFTIRATTVAFYVDASGIAPVCRHF